MNRPRTNSDRAGEALELCVFMQVLTGVDDLRDQVSDILCHLMHLCRLEFDDNGEKIDFAEVLASARCNFEAEIEEDPDR